MPTTTITIQALRAENAELRARLDEVEDTLRAIRAGEVDALVVESSAGPQIFTLQGLDAEQNRLRGEMLAQVGEAVIATDLEDRITYLNAAAERQYGIRTGDVLGRKLTEIYTRQWPSPEAEAEVLAALEERGQWCGEKVHRTFGGREIPVEASIAVLRDPDTGARNGMIVSIRDITDRKEAETALVASEAKVRAQFIELQHVYENAPVGLAIFDRDLRYLRINERLADINGLPAAEHLGRTIRETLPSLADAIDEVKAQILATGCAVENKRLVGETPAQPGVTRSWSVSWFPVRCERGEIIGFGVVVTETTMQDRAEAELRHNERRFRGIFDSAFQFIGLMSPDGILLEANRTALESGGLRAEDVIGKLFWECDWWTLTERTGQELQAAVGRAASGEMVRYDVDVRGAEGQVVTIDFSIKPIRDEAGRVVLLIPEGRDITGLKRAEETLRARTAELETLLDTLPAFVWIARDAECRVIVGNRTANEFVGVDMGANVSQSAVSSGEAPYLRQLKEDGTKYRFDELPLQRAVATGLAVRDAVIDFHFRDGRRALVVGDAVPLFDEQGRIRGGLAVFIDITERKSAEERLWASEARLRRVFESNVVGMIRWDLDRSLILDANAEFLRMTGYVRDDITSGRLNFRDLTPPEWTVRNEEGIRAIRADGQAPPYEKEYFHKDGSRLPLIIAGTRFEDSPSEGMSFLIDLTGMKQAEAALRERTALLDGVLESTTDVIYVKDLNGRMMLVNAAFAAAARSTPAELVGKTDEDLFPPEAAAAVRHIDEAVLAGGLPINMEETLPVAGEARVFHTQKAPLRDGTGRVVGVLGISRDITERKAAEAVVARLAAIVECSYDALLSEDLDGLVTSWNRGAEQIFGYRADEIVGTSIMRLIPEAGHPEEHELQRKIAAGERGGTFEGIRQAKDGREFHASITVSPMKDAAGKIIGTSRVIRDITDRKLVADHLREAKEAAEAANRSKDRFLAALSHELRTPLTPVLLVSGMHAKSEKLPDDLREDFEMIHRNIVLEAQLIDDLLDVSRIQQGKMRFDFKLMDVHNTLALTLEMLRSEVEEKALIVRSELNATPATIEADPTRLRQVLCNLLRNAVKFTPRGGTITVHTARDQSALEISITDTGAGIAAEDLERIFQPFEQVDIEQKGEHRSIGLGLAISAAIVAAHRGRIWAESPGPGEGSAFHVRLPF